MPAKTLRQVGGGSSRIGVDGMPGKMEWSFFISGDTLNKLWKTRRPDLVDSHWGTGRRNRFTGNDTYQIAKNAKGEYWCEWRSSRIFWANCWYEIPPTVAKRLEQYRKLVKDLS